MVSPGLVVLASGVAACGYATVGYPALLAVAARLRRRPPPALPAGPRAWPFVSVCVTVHNAESSIANTLERILASDYPNDLLQILVVSDASTDGTDDIVRGFAARGVALFRVPERVGKTAAEFAASPAIRGDIVVNTDASVLVDPGAVRALVLAFDDACVGAASGVDVSVSPETERVAASGEAAYVGYEMRVRALETRVYGIVGVSGCLYATRASIHRTPLPANAARDFAVALVARRRGLRTVSVPGAVCRVPQTTSLEREYRRKVRTITRGIETLWHFRELLNPLRFGAFAWMLWSHKMARWLVPVAAAAATVVAVGLLPRATQQVATALAFAGVLAALGALRLRRPWHRLVSRAAWAAAGGLAVLDAWVRFVRRRNPPVWEPTARDSALGTRDSAIPQSRNGMVLSALD